jgi:deazaflavin-dependent oxidoreductase (nitroreductase family)
MNSPLPSFRAHTSTERVFNRIFGFLVGLGLGFSYNYLLQVRGRKSGKIYSTPIDLLELGGKRFLVAPRGHTQWVRNAEAAGEVTLKKGSKRLKFGLRALSDQESQKSSKLIWISSGAKFRPTFRRRLGRQWRLSVNWCRAIPRLN